MTLPITIREWARRKFGSLEYERLANYIVEAWAEFDRQVQGAGPKAITEPWARSAYTLLLRAETYLKSWQIEGGWTVALSAQRAILSNPHNPERIQRAATLLRREADKLSGWRVKAIQDLIAGEKGNETLNSPEELARIIEAVGLRDDFSQNTYFKILLRRRHLFNLFCILWIAILLCLVLSWLQILPGFLRDVNQVTMVLLFGVLGAAVSVAQSLVVQNVSERIPTQQIGALVIWTRPGIGAAASLVVFALLNANNEFHFLGEHTSNPAVIAVFSFVAGYSERFIIGALERITPSAGPESTK